MEDVHRIRETLTFIRKKAGLFVHRKFLLPLHNGITKLTKDRSQFRIYNTLSREYVAVASITDKAYYLLTLLGYQASSDGVAMMQLPLWCNLPDVWCAFLEMCHGDLIVSKGDPTALQTLPDKALNSLLVARIFYHMYIGIQLPTSSTVPHLRPLLIDSIEASFTAIEEAAKRLPVHVLDPASTVGVQWETARVMVRVFLDSDDDDRINADYTAVANVVKAEIELRLPDKGLACIGHYLQNMQAVVEITWLGKKVMPPNVVKYLCNSEALPRGCVSSEYGESMANAEQLMKEAQKRTLSSNEIERFHLTVVWQTENFMRCFQPEFFESESAVQLATSKDMPQELAKMPATVEKKLMLTNVLELLEEAVGFFMMRKFVEVIDFAVSCILKSGGAMMARIINKGDPTFSSVSSQTELALDIMNLLGFHDHDSFPGSMMLADYEDNEATLRTFSDIAKEMLLLNLESIPPVHSIDDVVTLVAFLAYTFRIRLRVNCAYTPQHLRFLLTEALQTAVADFDFAIDRLELCPPESMSRAIWTNLKASFLAFPQAPNTGEAIMDLNVVTDDLGVTLLTEMQEIFPKPLTDFSSYLQNISAIVTNTKYGNALDQGSTFIFRNTTGQLVPNSFSPEFMEHNRVLQQIMDAALRREFTYEETVSVHQRVVWQACHFLSNLRASEIEMTASSAELVALARRQGLRLSPTLAAEAVPVAYPLVSTTSGGGNESDGEEKMDRDKSEKEERGLVTDRDSVRNLLEKTDDGGKLVDLLEDWDRDIVLGELKILTEEKANELESLQCGLSEIDDVLASDQPAVVKTALMEARKEKMLDVEKVSIKLTTLRQVVDRNSEPRSLAASFSSELLYCTLQSIGMFQDDVQVFGDLLVSALDMVPQRAADMLSNALGEPVDTNLRRLDICGRNSAF
eukprot:m.86539 g.86539  ORF g.86539 m.86539 type:complete len:915 (+) comp36506_c0_seq2:132-2876(+)